jgi:dTDP-4-dehydrorhamnose 3,5-epimerase
VPEGFAHGFQALTDNVEIFYQNSQAYHAASAAGVKWNDPAINVRWPLPVSVILPRDESWPDVRLRDGVQS